MRTALLRYLFVVGLAGLAPLSAAAEKFDFEDLAVGTDVRAQYGPRGVIFFDAYLDQDPHASSGTRVLRAVSPSAEVFNPVPLVMTFTSPQAHVAFRAGNLGDATHNGTLRVFDAGGAELAHDGPRPVPPGTFATTFEVQLPTASIVRAELDVEQSAFEAIDDLLVEGNPVSPPTNPPDVAITSPAEGAVVPAGPVAIRGTVSGDGLLDPITLRVAIGLPPDSTAPPSENAVSLSGSGTSRTFSFDYGVLTGPLTVTALATNTGNLTGSATVHFSSLPDAIRARFQAAGGAPTFGALRFGGSETGCILAAYDKGLIAAVGNQTFVVQGATFQKWMATRPVGAPISRLGCPTAEERDAVAGARAQDFARGRIYAAASGTFFVPSVFVSAIDTLGGEAGTGLPVADPTSDTRPVFNTWLFQQFRRTGVPLLSTLEIRGDPPRIFIERQAGDGALFGGVLRPNNPTIVQSFDCSTTSGPCAVAVPPDEAPFAGAERFCGFKEFDWEAMLSGVVTRVFDPPEWVPINSNNFPTPIWAVLFDVSLAKGDNPFSHSNVFEPCPTPTLEALVNETICPSDWDLKLRPLPGFRWMQAFGRDAVQLEFERVDFQHQLVAYGDPTPGDLIFAAGRFNVDCGHDGRNHPSDPFKFKTEIHPPFVFTEVKSVTRNGRPATQADIWVNRFFAGGGDAVEFDIQPPPRPSPQATLGVTSPGNQTGLVQVTFTPIFSFGPVRVRITAQQGQVNVTNLGQLKMRTDDAPFGFDGRLHVYWNCPRGSC